MLTTNFVSRVHAAQCAIGVHLGLHLSVCTVSTIAEVMEGFHRPPSQKKLRDPPGSMLKRLVDRFQLSSATSRSAPCTQLFATKNTPVLAQPFFENFPITLPNLSCGDKNASVPSRRAEHDKFRPTKQRRRRGLSALSAIIQV